MKPNRMKQKLRGGELVAVPEINRIFSPKIVEMLGYVGYDCIWIDMEHSDASYDQISALATAARAAEMDVVVRIARPLL